MSRLNFIEMTTTSIAGASGNGAVTCIAVTGLPTFTNGFGSGTRLVDYVIEDTVNLYFEYGYGSIAANVLTRTLVKETWDGTTYTSQGAAALAFGSSPTSGNIRIRIAPSDDYAMPIPAAMQTTIGSDAYKGWQPNAMYPYGTGPAAGSALGTTNEYYVPFLSIIRGSLSGFGLVVSTAGSGSNGIKCGLYEVGADALPGPCITQFNALTAGSTGFITDTTPGTWAVNAGPLRASPSHYYIGIMSNDATVALGKSNTPTGGVAIIGPLAHVDAYGFGGYLQKTQQNSYATGLPTGTPTGSYTIKTAAAGLFLTWLFLKIANS